MTADNVARAFETLTAMRTEGRVSEAAYLQHVLLGALDFEEVARDPDLDELLQSLSLLLRAVPVELVGDPARLRRVYVEATKGDVVLERLVLVALSDLPSLAHFLKGLPFSPFLPDDLA